MHRILAGERQAERQNEKVCRQRSYSGGHAVRLVGRYESRQVGRHAVKQVGRYAGRHV